MITPAEIKKKALQHWRSGRLLSTWLRDEDLFPLDIRFRKVSAKEALEHYAELRVWMNDLREESKERLGFGYTLELTASNHRQLGQQLFPDRIRFDSLPDLLRTIGKQREFERFCALAEATRREQPNLMGWLEENPLKLLKNLEVWPQVLSVCRYFCRCPRPDRYLLPARVGDPHRRQQVHRTAQTHPARTARSAFTYRNHSVGGDRPEWERLRAALRAALRRTADPLPHP
ncbi:MAG: hypothetical protein GXP51_02155 [Deltaproteobacteria bacterium]|nr:hypothetical protein [Deltaproteobacteria bacterium]